MKKVLDYLIVLGDAVLLLVSIVSILSKNATTEEYSYLFFVFLGVSIDLIRRIIKKCATRKMP